MRKQKTTFLSRIKKALCERQQDKELQRRRLHNKQVVEEFHNYLDSREY